MNLPEEIILLTLDDETGDVLGRQGMAAGIALAGAVLMELSLLGRVDTDQERLLIASGAPTGNAVLDAALRVLTLEGPNHSKRALILLSQDNEARRAALLETLVQASVLERRAVGFLRLFGTRYPKAPGRAESQEVRGRLRALVLGEDIPEPRDALLLGLVRASGLLPLLFSQDELAGVPRRLEMLVRLEALNRSLAVAVTDVYQSRLRAASG